MNLKKNWIGTDE